jgi:hypothetical protein
MRYIMDNNTSCVSANERNHNILQNLTGPFKGLTKDDSVPSSNTRDTYSAGSWFENRWGHLVSWLSFSVVSLSSSGEWPG